MSENAIFQLNFAADSIPNEAVATLASEFRV